MRVLISCPVFERDWILPLWFRAIENQAFDLDRIGFSFLVTEKDKPTLDILFDWHAKHPEVWCFDVIYDETKEHASHTEGSRTWTHERYSHMVGMRNALLDNARIRNPDRYFSLDSDIILQDETTIIQLIEITKECDAASPLAYMTPNNRAYPNVMTWVAMSGSVAYRKEEYPIGSLFQSDIIMAAKMMTIPVYNSVNYAFHRQGEDLAWSFNATQLDFVLYSASHIYTSHIMSRLQLKEYLQMGDDRSIYPRK